jgi:hypothetical protein
MKQGFKGVLFGGSVLIASYGYALHKSAEEPEFGPIVGLLVAVIGTAVAVLIIVFSLVEGAREARKAAAREFKMRLNQPKTGEQLGGRPTLVSPRVASNSSETGKSTLFLSADTRSIQLEGVGMNKGSNP